MRANLLSFLFTFSYTLFIASRAIPTSKDPSSPTPISEDESGNCDCYVVSGPEPGYFQHYQFWDFRRYPLVPRMADRNREKEEGEDHVDAYHGHGDEHEHEHENDDDDWHWDEDEDEDDWDGDDHCDRDHDHDHDHNDDNYDGPESVLLSDTPFAADWVIQKWHRPGSSLFPVPIANSKRNIFIARDPYASHGTDSTYLVLQTKRRANYSSTAEMESRLRNIYHCSLRVRMRVLTPDVPVRQPPSFSSSSSSNGQIIAPQRHSQTEGEGDWNHTSTLPPSGACAGIFTYHSKNIESDIEILTSDPPYHIRYANQPDYDPIKNREIPGASTIADLPVPWTEWTTHRLDWFPDFSRWYSDGELRDSRTYRVPSKPSMVVINLWSDGGFWTGDMLLGESVRIGIEWIELVYNVSSGWDDLAHVKVPPRDEGPDADADAVRNSGTDATAQSRCWNVCHVDDMGH